MSVTKSVLDQTLVIGAKGIIGGLIPWGIRADTTAQAKDFKPSAILVVDSALSIEFDSIASKFQDYKQSIVTLAEYAGNEKLPLIYLSSSAVFNGKRGVQFSELSKTSPTTPFGKFQLEMELLILDAYSNAMILRIGELFGEGVKSEFNQLVPKILKNEAAEVNGGYEKAYLYTVDMIDELAKLLQSKSSGVLHLANYGIATDADLASFVIARTKSSSKLSAESKESKSSALVSHKLKIRSWQLALSEYLRRVQNPPK